MDKINTTSGITAEAARDAWNALTDSERSIALGILSATATDDLFVAAHRAFALSNGRK